MKQFFDICSKITQFLLPQQCLLCAANCGKRLLCQGCEADLPRHPSAACPVCAMPSPQAEICGTCLKHPPAFDATFAAFSYAFPMDALLRAFKYSGKLEIAQIAANALSPMLATRPAPDLIIPMPLHPQRLQERGFNQSVEIARLLAPAFSLNVVERILHKEPQASLPLKQRAKNVKGVFAATQDLSGKTVLIVDDIMTSGASLNELAKTLKKAGAARVECAIVARTLPHHV